MVYMMVLVGGDGIAASGFKGNLVHASSEDGFIIGTTTTEANGGWNGMYTFGTCLSVIGRNGRRVSGSRKISLAVVA